MADPPVDDAESRIADALHSLSDDDSRLDAPPPDLWSRIESEIADDSAVPAAPTVVPLRARRVPSLPLWPLVAAAALVVLVLVGALALRSDDSGGDVEARASLTAADLPAGEPDAAGSAQIVEEDGERRLELQVDGLPAGDGFYEVWLLRPDLEGLQPLGTTDGRGDFIVPDELDLSTYSVVDVSREPLDGNPAHSGQSVLRGELA